MKGIDVHPEYQAGINFSQVKDEGYEAVFIKVSEGTSFVPSGLLQYVEQAKRHENTSIIRQAIQRAVAKLLKAAAPTNGFVIGYYHFLNAQDGTLQARHFVNTVKRLGGWDNKVLIVDFEMNGDSTPSDRVLKDFVAEFKRLTGKNIILYSGDGFWNGGEGSSGEASAYGVDGLWDARYADMKRHDNPYTYWEDIEEWYLSNAMWGGTPPPKRVAAQYTSQGRVAGRYVDVNHFFIKRGRLIRRFARN